MLLGVGPFELLVVLIVLLLVFGPEDLPKLASALGQGLRQLYHSALWRDMQTLTNYVRQLPYDLARQAELEVQQKQPSLRTDLAKGKAVTDALPPPPVLPPVAESTASPKAPESRDTAGPEDSGEDGA